MFDFLRNLGRTEEETQQETLSAYLDGELAPAERDRFEQQLARESDLQDKLAQMKFWQQQMGDLPARRVPRNFTLDPALYGRPQRHFLSSAYPVLRTATALTAFLLVIALAANVYMSSFSPGALSETLLAPALETAPTIEMAVEEAAPVEIARDDVAAVGEEEIVVEAEIAPEEDMAAEELPAEPPATPFALETTIDKESEAAEAPVEITEVEEAPQVEAATETAVEEQASDDREELLAEELRQELSQSLDFLDESSEPLEAAAEEALPATVDGAPVSEELPVEEALPATSPPDRQEQQLASQQSPQVDDTEIEPLFLIPMGLDTIILGLGLLFIILTTLTILARGRR